MFILVHIYLVSILAKLTLDNFNFFSHIVRHHHFCYGIGNILNVSLLGHLVVKI